MAEVNCKITSRLSNAKTSFLASYYYEVISRCEWFLALSLDLAHVQNRYIGKSADSLQEYYPVIHFLLPIYEFDLIDINLLFNMIQSH